MTHQDASLHVWLIMGTLAAGSACVLMTIWVLIKELGAHLQSDGDPIEGYVARNSAGEVAKVRVIVGVPAAALGVFALWILAAELTGPPLGYFPSGPDEANARYAVRTAAATAARVGVVRGDLWSVAAVATSAPLLFGPAGSSREQRPQADVEYMRMIADRAARLSPHDSRVWLVLAGLAFSGSGDDQRGTEALKLSYYMGPNELPLMPLRLLLAVSSNAISDEEIQASVPLDVQRMIMRRPDLKPSIALAYKNALPKGRAIIEAALKEADPGFLTTITDGGAGNR